MEWIKNNLPILSLLMLAVGTSRMMIFYKMFNIKIVSFLELTEVIQLQFNFFTASFMIISFSYCIFSNAIRRYYHKKIWVKLLSDSEINALNETEEIKEEYRIKSQKYVIFMKDFPLIIAVSIINIYAFMGILFALKESIELFDGHSEYEVSMTVDGIPIETNAYFLFVGRTKNFIFFYNRLDKRSHIFANSDVKNLVFKAGNHYNFLKLKNTYRLIPATKNKTKEK